MAAGTVCMRLCFVFYAFAQLISQTMSIVRAIYEEYVAVVYFSSALEAAAEEFCQCEKILKKSCNGLGLQRNKILQGNNPFPRFLLSLFGPTVPCGRLLCFGCQDVSEAHGL